MPILIDPVSNVKLAYKRLFSRDELAGEASAGLTATEAKFEGVSRKDRGKAENQDRGSVS